MNKFRFLIVYILFQCITINSVQAASLGGWTMGNPVAQGASAIVSATKNVMLNGKNVVKTSTALITPTATQVAKLLGKGVAGVALSVAVEQLLGAVDWVLDPANNEIRYKPKSAENCQVQTDCSSSQYLYTDNGFTNIKYATAYAACKGIEKINSKIKYVSNTETLCNWTATDGSPRSTSIAKQVNTAYNENAEEEQEKTIPLPTVAGKVISNAQSGNADAQVATTAAAADIINEAENDSTKARPIVNQLENNSKTATEETATGKAETKADEQTQTSNPSTTPNTGNTTTDITLDFPVFCGWAPTVCEAMKVVLNVPTLVSEYAESVKEYFKEETATDTELDIPEFPTETIDTDIAFSGECPADRETPFNLGMGTINFKLSYSLICEPISNAKPVLIFIGFFISALIIGGVKT